MNRGIFYTLRKHWKKSTFAALATGYGMYYMNNKHRANIVRRRLCAEAAEYGRQTTASTVKQRRVVVFFNPKAGSGRTRKALKDDAVPIFNLAGIDVVYIELDYVGQAKTLISYLDETTDTIVIAGGSGTIMEVVTGLLTKYNEESKSCPLPIGIIPLGDENSLFEKLLPDRCKNMPKARIIGEAALAIVKKDSKMIDVMKISPQKTGKTIYALSYVKWGIFRDIASDYDRYWLAGPLKKRLAYIAPVLFNWPPEYNTEIAYNACNTAPTNSGQNLATSLNKSTAQSANFILSSKETLNTFEVDIDANRTKVYNGRNLKLSVVVICDNAILSTEQNLAVSIWPEAMDKADFISAGWRQMKQKHSEQTKLKTLTPSQLFLNPSRNDMWYTIDGEDYEAYPIFIKLLPHHIQLYYPS